MRLRKNDDCSYERRFGVKEVVEKLPRERKGVPQRLKPHCEQSSCGTAEAVPLSKTDAGQKL
jgi:hypothetical protein